MVAEACGNRTHLARVRRHAGFEDQEGHQAQSASSIVERFSGQTAQQKSLVVAQGSILKGCAGCPVFSGQRSLRLRDRPARKPIEERSAGRLRR